jgi:hypothetical protein
MDKKILIPKVVSELKTIKEIKAIVLAGSHATGIARTDSDIDFGIFYSEKQPLDIEKITQAAKNLGAFPNAIIAKIGEWGTWMNGGAWMIIDKQRVDFIYRNVEFIEKTIEESIQGKIQTDFFQQPAYGFYSYMYCSETKFNSILYDPSDIVKKLKEKVQTYPQKLKHKIINEFLWDAQFSFSRAGKSAKRDEMYIVAGCLTRTINDLVQVLYALNETFYISEKKFYTDYNLFKIKPPHFLSESQNILSLIGRNRKEIAINLSNISKMIQSCIKLTKGMYKPKYSKNLDNVK